jgi:hypothetical protein
MQKIWSDLKQMDSESTSNSVDSIATRILAKWLVKTNVAHDSQKAYEHVETYVGKQLLNEGEICFTEFSRLFQRQLFKKAL